MTGILVALGLIHIIGISPFATQDSSKPSRYFVTVEVRTHKPKGIFITLFRRSIEAK